MVYLTLTFFLLTWFCHDALHINCQSGKNTESVTWWHQRVYFVPVTAHVMIQPIRKTVGDLTLISGGARIIETYAYHAHYTARGRNTE